MSDQVGILRVRNWKRFQHYHKPKPPWVKLYRDVLGDYPMMYCLEAADRWLVIGLWMLAAETDNAIPNDPQYLAHRLRVPVDTATIAKLQTLGFIEDGASARESLDTAYSQTETEERRDREEIENNNGLRPDVDNSEPDDLTERYRGAEAELLTPGEEPISGTTTISSVTALADELLGLNALPSEERKRNRRLVTTWDGQGRNLDVVADTIRGLAAMVHDRRPEVAEWLKLGEPIGLRALQNTSTLYEQGDGKAQRPLWDVAYEYSRRTDRPRDPKRGGGFHGIAIDIPGVA